MADSEPLQTPAAASETRNESRPASMSSSSEPRASATNNKLLERAKSLRPHYDRLQTMISRALRRASVTGDQQHLDSNDIVAARNAVAAAEAIPQEASASLPPVSETPALNVSPPPSTSAEQLSVRPLPPTEPNSAEPVAPPAPRPSETTTTPEEADHYAEFVALKSHRDRAIEARQALQTPHSEGGELVARALEDDYSNAVDQVVNELCLIQVARTGEPITEDERKNIRGKVQLEFPVLRARRQPQTVATVVTEMPEADYDDAVASGVVTGSDPILGIGRLNLGSPATEFTADNAPVYLPGGEKRDPLESSPTVSKKKSEPTAQEKKQSEQIKLEHKRSEAEAALVKEAVHWFIEGGYLENPDQLEMVLLALQSRDAVTLKRKVTLPGMSGDVAVERNYNKNDEAWLQILAFALQSPLNPYRENPYRDSRASSRLINGLTESEVAEAEKLIDSEEIDEHDVRYLMVYAYNPKLSPNQIRDEVRKNEKDVVRGKVKLEGLYEELEVILQGAKESAAYQMKTENSGFVVIGSERFPQLTRTQVEMMQETILSLLDLYNGDATRKVSLPGKLMGKNYSGTNNAEWNIRQEAAAKSMMAKREAEETEKKRLKAEADLKAKAAAEEAAERERLATLGETAESFIRGQIFVVEVNGQEHQFLTLEVLKDFDRLRKTNYNPVVLTRLVNRYGYDNLNRLTQALELVNNGGTQRLTDEYRELMETLQDNGFGDGNAIINQVQRGQVTVAPTAPIMFDQRTLERRAALLQVVSESAKKFEAKKLKKSRIKQHETVWGYYYAVAEAIDDIGILQTPFWISLVGLKLVAEMAR